VRNTWAACRTPSRFMPSIRNGRHWIAGTSVAPNARRRDRALPRVAGLPLMSISRPSYPWILKELGWFDPVSGCANNGQKD
jgi:hypothetical protein